MLFNKKFFDGGYPNVVPVVYFIGLYPLDELLKAYLHLEFFDDILYMVGVVLYHVLEPSEEHS